MKAIFESAMQDLAVFWCPMNEYMAILSCFQDFFYSLNAKAHSKPDLLAIRWSWLFAGKVTMVSLTCCQVYRQFGAADCWTILFFEKVAVCAGTFKPKRVVFCGVNQDPVGFDVAVARWLPRSHEWMVSVVRWKRDVLYQKLNNLLQLVQVLPSFPHALDIPGKLPGLRDLLHFSQFLNIASKDSNS